MKYTINELISGYINLVYYPNKFERRILTDIPLRITLEKTDDGIEVVIIKEYINEIEANPYGTSYDLKATLHTDAQEKEIEKEILEELLTPLNDYIESNLPEYVKEFKPVTMERATLRIINKEDEK